MNLLQESLLDDAKGIVNIAREKETRKLADKLKNGNEEEHACYVAAFISCVRHGASSALQ